MKTHKEIVTANVMSLSDKQMERWHPMTREQLIEYVLEQTSRNLTRNL